MNEISKTIVDFAIILCDFFFFILFLPGFFLIRFKNMFVYFPVLQLRFEYSFSIPNTLKRLTIRTSARIARSDSSDYPVNERCPSVFTFPGFIYDTCVCAHLPRSVGFTSDKTSPSNPPVFSTSDAAMMKSLRDVDTLSADTPFTSSQTLVAGLFLFKCATDANVPGNEKKRARHH